MMVNPIPKELQETEAWYEDPGRALMLWERGFRPMRAVDLEKGMRVAYRVTDVFQMQPTGEVKEGLINKVVHEEETCGVKVYHSATVTESDDGDEVWAKPSEKN